MTARGRGGSPGQACFDLEAARSEPTSRAHGRAFWVTTGQPGQVRCDLVCALVARGARAGNRSAPLGLEYHPRAIEIGPNQAGQDSNVEPAFSVTPMLPLRQYYWRGRDSCRLQVSTIEILLRVTKVAPH